MEDEYISFEAMGQSWVGSMAYTTHSGDFGLRSDRTAPVASGIGAKLARLARRLSDALATQRQREVDLEIASALARSGGRITDSMEREMMEKVLASDWSLPQ
jgi:hypothetical protein